MLIEVYCKWSEWEGQNFLDAVRPLGLQVFRGDPTDIPPAGLQLVGPNYQADLDDRLWVELDLALDVTLLTKHFDVMIRDREGNVTLAIDEKGKSFRQR